MVAIGIDIGNVYARVALAKSEGDKVHAEVIDNDDGKRSLRSCIAFAEERQFGETALQHIDEKNIIYDFKRLIGCTAKGEQLQQWPFKCSTSVDGAALVEVTWNGRTVQLTPQELFAMMLEKMIDVATMHAGASADNDVSAVITVPSSFTSSERQAVKDAALLAGLKSVRLVNDTTAAAIAYAMQRPTDTEQTVLFCNFGGGSTDISIVIVRGTDVEVRATIGDSQLGGVDFDRLLTEHLAQKHADGPMSPSAHRLLKNECEKAKEQLSRSKSTRVAFEIDGFTLNTYVTRDEFEQVCRGLFLKIEAVLHDCLRQAQMDPSNIDQILLVGGCSRIPKIREIVSVLFPEKRNNQTLNVDEAVVSGAALFSASLWPTHSESSKLLSPPREICGKGIFAVGNTGRRRLVAPCTSLPVVHLPTTITGNFSSGYEIKICEGNTEASFVENASMNLQHLSGHSTVEIVLDVDEDGIIRSTASQCGTRSVDASPAPITVCFEASGPALGYRVEFGISDRVKVDSQRKLPHTIDRTFRTAVDGTNAVKIQVHKIIDQGRFYHRKIVQEPVGSLLLEFPAGLPEGAGISVHFTQEPNDVLKLRAAVLREELPVNESLVVSETHRSLTSDEVARMRGEAMTFKQAEAKRALVAKVKNAFEAFLIEATRNVNENMEYLPRAVKSALLGDLKKAQRSLGDMDEAEKVTKYHQTLMQKLARARAEHDPKAATKYSGPHQAKVASISDKRNTESDSWSSQVSTPQRQQDSTYNYRPQSPARSDLSPMKEHSETRTGNRSSARKQDHQQTGPAAADSSPRDAASKYRTSSKDQHSRTASVNMRNLHKNDW